jgi:hypothetical protein
MKVDVATILIAVYNNMSKYWMVYLDVPECLELRGCFSLFGIGWGHGLFPTFPTPGSE